MGAPDFLFHTLPAKVGAGATANLTSGGDTMLKGAVVEGKRIVADVGGNLAIESLQDTVSLSSPVVTAAQTVGQMTRAGETSEPVAGLWAGCCNPNAGCV